ncbi:MAG TPA: TldD/PmbA family protein [Acidimicrobiales bacterium]|nr:TldD/PmbA family protein [Acidimicrobiales bacterium]
MTDLLDVADAVAALAHDGEQLEAYVERSRDTQVRVHDGGVEQLAVAESLGVGVRVVRDHRQGFAYCGTFDAGALGEAVAEARDNAAFAEPDDLAGLAKPDGVEPAALDLWRPGLAEVPTDRKVDLLLELERAVRAADGRISGFESCDYADVLGESAVVTTTGIRRATRATGCEIVAYPLATDGDETQLGFGFSVGRAFEELDLDATVREAVERSVRLLGATQPPSGRLTIVLDPWVTAQLVGVVAGTLSGEEVVKGRSLFAERVGEQVATPALTLLEDPTDVRAWGAATIDDEGLATRRVPLVDYGVLRGFVHSTWTARRSGTTSTGSAVRGGFKTTPSAGCRAARLLPGPTGPAELLAGVDDGVLVQDVSGLHSGVNAVSGDLSTGAQGLRIRGGELAEPLREFTIASTLQRLLHDVTAVGNDLTWLPMSAAGVTLVVGDVSISGA